jgi:hypothetical protein
VPPPACPGAASWGPPRFELLDRLLPIRVIAIDIRRVGFDDGNAQDGTDHRHDDKEHQISHMLTS